MQRITVLLLTEHCCAAHIRAELSQAEQDQLALHRKSMAQSVTKVLAESGMLAHFKNMSNPLYGTQPSVTVSQAPGVAAPAPLSVGPVPGPGVNGPAVRVLFVAQHVVQCDTVIATALCRHLAGYSFFQCALVLKALCVAGAPLSPISENTNSRHWQSTETLRQSGRSRGAPTDEGSSGRLDRRQSGASRPSTADTDRSRNAGAARVSLTEQQRPGLGFSAGALGLSGIGPRNGDMDSFMEDLLHKERSAFREQQQRLKQSVAQSRHSLRRSDARRSADDWAGQ